MLLFPRAHYPLRFNLILQQNHCDSIDSHICVLGLWSAPRYHLFKLLCFYSETTYCIPANRSYMVDVASFFPVEPTEPKPERHVVHDTTYQKLGEILAHNPRGVLALSDELSGLLQSLDSPGQGAARGFYLTGWGGELWIQLR